MKAQMFLITVIIIIGGLVILASTINFPSAEAERKYLEGSLEKELFTNIEEETKNTIAYSFYEDIEGNVLDFFNFTRKIATARGLSFKALYVGVNASLDNIMNISFINMFGETLNVSMELNSTPIQSSNFTISDSSIHNTTFDFNPGDNYTLEIIISELSYNESITIDTEADVDTYVAFFDIRLISPNALRREKYQNMYFG